MNKIPRLREGRKKPDDTAAPLKDDIIKGRSGKLAEGETKRIDVFSVEKYCRDQIFFTPPLVCASRFFGPNA